MPWFADKMPDYYNLWALSASYNKDYDFYIISNLKFNSDYSNIFLINYSFEDLKYKFEENLGLINLKRPYKLCDYKIAYGYIFKEIVDGYDYWGFSDFDIIYGELNKFIKDTELVNYDRFGVDGHFSLLKNSTEINCLFLKKHNYKEAYTFNEVKNTDFSCAFDEIGDYKFGYGMSYVMEKKGYRLKKINSIADISIKKINFNIKTFDNQIDNIIFKWEHGNLKGYYSVSDSLKCKDFAYLHLQKRNVDNANRICNDSFFWILPNRFISKVSSLENELNSLTIKEKDNKRYWRKKRKGIIMNRLKTGGIKNYINRKTRTIFSWK